MNALELITATVEPGSHFLPRYRLVASALTRALGRPVSVDDREAPSLEFVFGFPGIPAKPTGIVASCCVFDGVYTLNVDFNLLGGMYCATVDPSVGHFTEANAVTAIRKVVGLARSQEFKALVASEDYAQIHAWLRKNDFACSNTDAIAAVHEIQRTPALQAWARR